MSLQKLRDIKEKGLTQLTSYNSKEDLYVILEADAEYYLFKYWKNKEKWEIDIKVKADTNLKEIEKIMFKETKSIVVSNNRTVIRI